MPVDNNVREALSHWRKLVRHQLPDVRWAKPENYHITVKFYGDLDVESLARLTAALREPLSSINSFKLELVGLGTFPNWDHPRVLWAGVGDGIEHMRYLAGVVEAASVGLELPVDRKDYRPHLTLARFKAPVQRKDIGPDVLNARNQRWGVIHVTEAILFRSRLTPQGPIHTVHQRFHFNTDNAKLA